MEAHFGARKVTDLRRFSYLCLSRAGMNQTRILQQEKTLHMASWVIGRASQAEGLTVETSMVRKNAPVVHVVEILEKLPVSGI